MKSILFLLTASSILLLYGAAQEQRPFIAGQVSEHRASQSALERYGIARSLALRTERFVGPKSTLRAALCGCSAAPCKMPDSLVRAVELEQEVRPRELSCASRWAQWGLERGIHPRCCNALNLVAEAIGLIGCGVGGGFLIRQGTTTHNLCCTVPGSILLVCCFPCEGYLVAEYAQQYHADCTQCWLEHALPNYQDLRVPEAVMPEVLRDSDDEV